METENQGKETFLNPILRGNYADPSILRVGTDYYMVNTSYTYTPGLIVWHSKNLVDWTPIASALEHPVGDVWAPEFVRHGDTFYIYFPANRTNWVVTAKDPAGPWSEPIDLQTPLIDPGHVVGPDGKRYLYLSGGHIVPLTDDGCRTAGDVKKVYEPWKYPQDWVVEGFSPEGPKATQYRGYYYVTTAIGGTAGPPTSHMVVSSRSKTPWGPWEHSPYNPIIRTYSREEKWWSQGHGTLVDTPSGDWWMVYHAYENGFHTLGRHTMLLPIEWTADGWFKVPDGVSPERPINKPDGASGAQGFPTRDDFTSETIGLHWQWFKKPQRDRFQSGGGELVVAGTGESPIDPLLYMMGHPSYEAEIEVIPEGEEAEAKFMLFYNDEAHFGLAVSKRGVRHFRTFKSYQTVPLQGERVRLRIKNDRHIVSFYYKEPEGAWRKYDKVLDASGFHHNTFGGFLSLRIGLDAAGEGKVRFRDFLYRVL